MSEWVCGCAISRQGIRPSNPNPTTPLSSHDRRACCASTAPPIRRTACPTPSRSPFAASTARASSVPWPTPWRSPRGPPATRTAPPSRPRRCWRRCASPKNMPWARSGSRAGGTRRWTRWRGRRGRLRPRCGRRGRGCRPQGAAVGTEREREGCAVLPFAFASFGKGWILDVCTLLL